MVSSNRKNKQKRIAHLIASKLLYSYQYGLEEHKHLWTSKTFKKSCRGVSFTLDGSSMKEKEKKKKET